MPCKRFRRESGPLPFSRHFLFYMKIQKLTKEEIETLQVDAVLRLLGGFTNQLIDTIFINTAIFFPTIQFFKI